MKQESRMSSRRSDASDVTTYSMSAGTAGCFSTTLDAICRNQPAASPWERPPPLQARGASTAPLDERPPFVIGSKS